jgi:hypothetical protein
MSGVEVFTGRDARAATVERMTQPGSALARADLEGQFRIATAIANATEAVPKGYRKQPGAVLLALAWAQQHDVDLLTAIQQVSFVEGRAVVDATMQRALAKRAGYELRIGLRDDAATVEVFQHGEGLGAATYSMADAEAAGLTAKRNWQQNREDMLVARATTRAVRRFAPDVLLGLLSSDEVDEPPPSTEPPGLALTDRVPPPFAAEHGLDPAAPVTNVELPEPPEGAQGGAGANPAPAVDPPPPPSTSADVPPSAEVGRTNRRPWSSGAAMRVELRERGITVPMAVKEAHAIALDMAIEPPSGSMDSIVRSESTEFVETFAAWVRSHDPAA